MHKCESCGEPFEKHLGLVGTCKQLQVAKEIIESQRATILHYKDKFDFYFNSFTKAKKELRKIKKAQCKKK